MKTFDLEKLQSLTLSGEKITKEIFDALFLNASPYYFANPTSSTYPFNYNAATSFDETAISPYQHRSEENFNTRNYEIFSKAFETAASFNKNVTEIPDYQCIQNRFYQGQNYFQSF